MTRDRASAVGRWAWLGCVAACLWLPACRSGPGGGCRNDSGCKPGLLCAEDRTCQEIGGLGAAKACGRDNDCPAGAICTQLVGVDQRSCETPAFTERARRCGLGSPSKVCAGVLPVIEQRQKMLKRSSGPLPGARCARQDECRESGACIGHGSACVAEHDADCAASRRCSYLGECKVLRGRCEVPAVSDADCKRPREAVLAALVHPPQLGTRWIVDRYELDASNVCEAEGRCTVRDGICVASSDGDCAKSSVCLQLGWCAARDGRCVAPATQGCRYRVECARSGACTSRAGRCVAGGDTDCRLSYACRNDGRCSDKDGVCVAADDSACRRSRNCQRLGHCTALAPECVARSDEDCRRSDACRVEGACALVGSHCASKTEAH